MTLVPCPAFSGGSGSEVGAAHVHDAGGEAQQAAVSVGPVHPGGRGGQAVLLISTGQQVEGSVLQVGRLLDELGIQHKVGSSYRDQDAKNFTLISQKRQLCSHGCWFWTHFLHM